MCLDFLQRCCTERKNKIKDLVTARQKARRKRLDAHAEPTSVSSSDSEASSSTNTMYIYILELKKENLIQNPKKKILNTCLKLRITPVNLEYNLLFMSTIFYA